MSERSGIAGVPRVVLCPQCGRSVEWSATSRWRPFCSARCRTIDLGAWASETYRVPVVDTDDADDSPRSPGTHDGA